MTGRALCRVAAVGMLGLLASLAMGLSALAAQCVGDCDQNDEVSISELITVVNISLGNALISECRAGDANGSDTISIEELIAAVNSSLEGCPPTPTTSPSLPVTPTPTPTQNVTATPTPSLPPGAVTPGDGLSIAITEAVVASDPAGQITVTFTLTDASGIPVRPVLSSTDGQDQARVRFTIAHVEDYNAGGELRETYNRYVNDIDMARPRYDRDGALETVDAANGVYRYTFNTLLPADYDASLTYSVGMQVDRTFAGRQLAANPVYDFVPAGGTPRIREGAATEQCNACHAPLIAHRNRREVRLCTLCHTEAAVDERGRSVDFRNMVHKIHRGKALPSIVDGAPGSTYAIYSSFQQQDVVFAQKDANGVVSGVGFPRAIQACTVCHAAGATAEYHRERPSTKACAACHDDVNPSREETAAGPPGTNHVANAGFFDGQCHLCHVADAGEEFDISVAGAHAVPERSSQLKGLSVEITGITNHGAGQTPTISFKVSEAGSALLDLSGLDHLAFAMSGATTDYAVMLTATAIGGGASGMLTPPDGAGVFQYTPTTAVPDAATGTWAIGAEARRAVLLAAVDPIEPKTVEEAAINPVLTFTVDDSIAAVRRVVVDDQQCGNCHGEFSRDFSVHGNLRNQVEYCVICHNANQSDVARRRLDAAAVAQGDSTASIDFKVMIHKIHTGEKLEQKPYLIYGSGPPPPAGTGYTVRDFAEVRFPGDRRNCETCHVPGTSLLPPYPGAALGTRLTRLDPATGDEVEEGRLGRITAVCTSCHDADDAMAHAETMTTTAGEETCRVCHEEGRAFPVSELHAGRR